MTEKKDLSPLKGLYSTSRNWTPPFGCKQKNSACGSQVHPKLGSSGTWAAPKATQKCQICPCCSPGGMGAEPPGKQGTEAEERLTDLVSDQMDGSK